VAVTSTAAPPAAADAVSTGYKRYLLVLLLFVLAFNYVDRQVLALVLQAIKVDFDLSDTELGLLTGIAFALFYSVMGIPIARWADRGNRVTLIALTTLLWSGAVALCGAAGNFVQLVSIRIGVAVGEAGCIPPAHSLIADHFTREERPRAVALYMLGAPLSLVIGYFLSGWLNELFGWRATFVIVGLPGLVLSLLVWLTLWEPRSFRPRSAATPAAAVQPDLRVVWKALWANFTFRHLLLFFAVGSFFNYGITQWQPAFFIRSYGLQTGELGTWLAVTQGVCGIVGTWWGGELATRYAANNERMQLAFMAIAYCGFGVLTALIYLSPNHYLAFSLLGVASLGGSAINGPMFAAIQTVVPQQMRAVSIAIIYLFANLIGIGLGPVAAGALSDAFRGVAADESLRYALLALCPGYLWGAWHLWRASQHVSDDVRALECGGSMGPSTTTSPRT
jgi:predicted MFS family arabinose efflux permease